MVAAAAAVSLALSIEVDGHKSKVGCVCELVQDSKQLDGVGLLDLGRSVGWVSALAAMEDEAPSHPHYSSRHVKKSVPKEVSTSLP